ncbi:NAD-dependent epimerase/dehydratase family protein [Pseudoxanthomonas indica]|uniref:Nucleoside-diphosphate-sugar epimerase n=1 Tax=Pseudoxanthomonas indica TaxID=428993 RepID=A0A1T5JY63_9GAMM|nr:NAD-dependent epimerase/dehydratase family protein [Pseudoxanthomonas indica]GGD45274.1 nucleoside-diphosphate sugar epimerase [Pseudoxanthomonas indica]SKC56323.1 Nucleoside-diphosphate-sugar epimerase [Pseudoxanthomonas indica]
MSLQHARSALVFGGSGPIGAALLTRLMVQDWTLLAISRRPPAPSPGPAAMRWLPGEFAAMPELPEQVDVIFSTGPLDHFARWYANARIRSARVVAFGSTSVLVKSTSSDPEERDLAQRLHVAEQTLFEAARERGAAATVLRPTLVYGTGQDRNLSRIAAMARRSGFFLLPSDAQGLRQPVHVQDLAQAAEAVVDVAASAGKAYALPGGETLRYDEMVQRLLRAMQPSPRLIRLPAPLFRGVVSVARRLRKIDGLSDTVLARLREDLAFDASAAREDFAYAPRAFTPGDVPLP